MGSSPLFKNTYVLLRAKTHKIDLQAVVHLLMFTPKNNNLNSVRKTNNCGVVPVKVDLQVYTHVVECERMLLAELDINKKSMKVQSLDVIDEECDDETTKILFDYALRYTKNLIGGFEEEWLFTQIDNITIILDYARKCKSILDYTTLVRLSYRLLTGKSFSKIICEKFMCIFKSEVQAYDTTEVLHTMRAAFDMTNEVKETPLIKKLVSLYSFALTQGFLSRFGFSLSDEDYSRMEQRAMLNAFSSKKAFFVCVLDTTLFICEKLNEWRITGDISVFIHSSNEYTNWIKKADELLLLSPFIGNLEAHNTSYFSYLSDLRDTIEKGEAYAKFVRSTAGVDAKIIKNKLYALQLQHNTEITRRAAQQERSQPMGVLVYGGSSIAKSAFTKILFNYYGGLFDLERGDHFRFVRNPMDEYWSNFDSSKWCIQLDDIAFRNPAKTSDVDPTLQDLLNVVNNVPYVPPQAAIEDKGKTPVMAKLVIATSNCEHLNAQEYFWCPLAVRRRLPFVVTLKPKTCFLHENQRFIDPKKLVCEDGKFPNFWEITVSKIVPQIYGSRENAILEVVKVFDEIEEFLQYFGKACLEHENNQKQAMTKDKDMLCVEVCKQCLKPLPHEVCVQVQAADEIDARFYFRYYLHVYYLMRICTGQIRSIFALFLHSLFDYLITFDAFLNILHCAARVRAIKMIICFIANNYFSDNAAIKFFGSFGERMQDPKIRKLLACGIAMSGALTLYYVASRWNRSKKNKTDEVQVQGNVFGTTEETLLKEERNNVWYNPTIELTTFDVPKASTSLVGTSSDSIRNILSSNCVFLRIRVEGEQCTRVMRGTFIKGHFCLTNAHAFKKTGDKYIVSIMRQNQMNPLSSSIDIHLTRNDISFDEINDVCVFEVLSLPPFKDIIKFWTKDTIYPSDAIELTREISGTVSINELHALNYLPRTPVKALQGEFNIYMCTSQRLTEEGQCGSLCVSNTPRGPVIIGIHFLGKDHSMGILKIDANQIANLIQNGNFLNKSIVQSGSEPLLNCKDKQNVLSEIHHKSILRYMEKGSLNVYGTFTGFRPKPKSQVCATPLQELFLEHYCTEVKHGKPAMDGWEPWRKNVVEMVVPDTRYDKTILKSCVDAFYEDIISNLPTGWEKELVVLSDKAAVNGLPGVMYIDKIASNTSMGFPWCCTKKAYLHEDVCEKYPDGINFDSEVWDRVRHIESVYAEGKRAYPVFTGHLKDEATPLKKCEIKKTRMFTGAPVDWSLVVRKNLLSFVRLLQKNKFVFEAGPGTVAQSSEWGVIRDYLTSFGEDQIVAGDYGKFDKRMIADFILAAFSIIERIHKRAGFSDTECMIISCIGEDTAFPLSNINGDLLEFFGTNPSGHPLTVIINSLVNSLYMRYCYLSLNPNKEVNSFKKHVHLFTYGDDNIMGVSVKTPWFNHTAIQSVLNTIGVEYTMADKESKSVPYVNIADVSFLKRTWVWNPDVNNWVCPLEESSIIKSLTMWVPSKTINCYHQMVAVISSANSEYFFYGKKVFEEKHSFFKRLLSEEPYCFYVNESTLPTYNELVERFKRASLALQK